jgi:hypothetical protein
MLEQDPATTEEGSGTMLFQVLKSLLMIMPQSPCYRILRDRLVSVSRFRQSTMCVLAPQKASAERESNEKVETNGFVARALSVRNVHCEASWRIIREESLEIPKHTEATVEDDGATRRLWLGYASREEQVDADKARRDSQQRGAHIEELENKYHELGLNDDE